MSDHWRLAVRGAASMVVLAVPVAAVIFYFVLEVAFQVPLLKGPLESALGLY